MQLVHSFTEDYHSGKLAFENFGRIDKVSNYPARSSLFVDCDSKAFSRLPKPWFIRWVLRLCELRCNAIVYRETKRGFHIIVQLSRNVSALERVALEAIIGDDKARAALNLMRARKIAQAPKFWQQRWNILYSEKIYD